MCKNLVLLCITMVHIQKKHDAYPKACYLPRYMSKTGYYHGTSPEKRYLHSTCSINMVLPWYMSKKVRYYDGKCPKT